ncbi:MAG: AAA family ATPase, partial [Acidobacteria bacterium]|nr:AAA family ATPase [Acidobacteriota bacterium]
MLTAPCPSCSSANPLGEPLCSACGESFRLTCSTCGFENPCLLRFCGACGAALSLGREETTGAVSTGVDREGERRHLSVMFCDLMDSTALSEELDPEDLRDTVKAYQEVCSQVIHRFEGSIAQYLGDGILAYFGYPVAHEDDARRAAKAGLEITRQIRTLNRRLGRHGEAELAVRIGIHTGLVVVGEVGAGEKRERLAMGQTPNIAARLQGLARPNGVVISGATERLVRRFFRIEEAGKTALKGVSRPIQVFRVMDATSRLRGLGPAAELTPLVARERKLALLLECWQKAELGQGQIVLLRGEAGIGKTRLVEVFKEELGGRDHRLWELQSASYHQNSAFFPLTEALHRMLRRSRSTSPEEETQRLERTLRRLLLPVNEAMPLLTSLLSLPLPPGFEPVSLPPTRQRRETLEMLAQWVERLADRQPLLLVAEDLHWMDPSTVEFLGLLAERCRGSKLMLLATFRPDFQPGWAGREGVKEVSVNRLTAADGRVLAEQLVGDHPLPKAVIAELVNRSDGNPLFLEELTKTFLESVTEQGETAGQRAGSDLLRSLEIPHRLHDSLLARLDRLGSAKDVAQLGAILGRSFRLDLLRAVSTAEPRDLEESLERLVDADMLIPRNDLDQVSYQFKHSLLQETAYQSLLKKQRRRLHWQVVQALERSFPATGEAEPEVLAHHCTEAQLVEPAIRYWRQAGQRAVERFANQEALRHLGRGLELVQAQPASAERNRLELPYRIIIAPAMMATRGLAAPEVQETYERARKLSLDQPGDALNHAALRGLLRFATARGEFQHAEQLSRRFLDAAKEADKPELLAEAHWITGSNLFHLGRAREAERHLARARKYFDAERRVPEAFQHAVHPAVSCRVYSSYCLWLMGRPRMALATARENLGLARELENPMSEAVAFIASALVHLFLRRPAETQAHARAGMDLASLHQIPHWREMGAVLLGWALCEQGKMSEGLEAIEGGIAGWRASA